VAIGRVISPLTHDYPDFFKVDARWQVRLQQAIIISLANSFRTALLVLVR